MDFTGRGKTKDHTRMGKNHMIVLKCQRAGSQPSGGHLAFALNSFSEEVDARWCLTQEIHSQAAASCKFGRKKIKRCRRKNSLYDQR